MVGWDLQTASRRTGKPSLSVPWSASPGRRLAVLAADGVLQEGVWFRLEGLAGGMLAGVLLNEPDADCPVHEGDFMALAPPPGRRTARPYSSPSRTCSSRIRRGGASGCLTRGVGEKDLPARPAVCSGPYAPSPHHFLQYSSRVIRPAATSSMSWRFLEAVSCTMESSYITDTPPSSGNPSPML